MPEYAEERCPTGVPGLDDLVGGGLIRGRSILLKGTCGVGKSIMGAQFICNGMSLYGEPGVLVILEQNLANFKKDVLPFNLDLGALEEAGGLILIDASLSRYSLRRESFAGTRRFPAMVGDRFGIEEIIDYILESAREIGAKRVVIDNLPAIDNLLKNPASIRDNILLLSRRLQDNGLTSLLISDVLEEREDDVESYVADGVIVIEHFVQGLKTERQLYIKKMRGTSHSEGIHPIEFVEGVGVKVNTSD